MEWIYGRNVVSMALAAGARRPPRRLALTAAAQRTLAAAVPPHLQVDIVAGRELDQLTGSNEHQGAAALVEAPRYAALDELAAGELLVVLDEISDPRNLGAVLRSAAAAGASGVIIPRHRAAELTPAAVKASAGLSEHLPTAQVTNIVNALDELKRRDFWVYGAAGGAKAGLWDLDLGGRCVLVFGAEGRGLRPLVARHCDVVAQIPMAAPVESLNVSVAAALFLFEARRQRNMDAGS